MKILKKLFNYFGYSITRKHKSESLENLLKLRLEKNPCDCLIDVGSNVGDFLHEYCSFFTKSYAFEPNYELIPELKKRFISNHNIEIFNEGVGLINENTYLNLTNDKGKTLSSIKKQNKIINEILRNTKVIDTKMIKIINLHNFIKNKKIQDKSFFLKTDTQGNDLEVLLGLKEFIKKIKFIKIEMPIINIYEIDYNYNQINKFMEDNKFVPLYFQHLSRGKSGKLIEYDVVFEKSSE